MPRKKREQSSTGVYHWIVRGMNKKDLFHDAQDFEYFKKLLSEYKTAYQISFFHYCLMTNHVHLLLRANDLEYLASFSHYVQRRYAYYYCGRYKWTGSVFQRGYRSFVIDRDEYMLECGRYIERNPVKAKLVEKPGDYKFTSYRYYAVGESDEMLTDSPAYMGLSSDEGLRRIIYAKRVEEHRVQEEMMERGLLPAGIG